MFVVRTVASVWPVLCVSNDTQAFCILNWTIDQTEKRSPNTNLVSLEPHLPIGASNKEWTLAVIPVQVKHSRGSQIVQMYAFLDPGSSATFCTEALMTQLNAKGKKMWILLKMLGQEKPVTSYSITRLEVSGLNSNTFLDLPDASKRIPAKHPCHQRQHPRWTWRQGVTISDGCWHC